MAATRADKARYAVDVTGLVSSRLIGVLACAVAVCVPQLALLLTSPVRVGSFVPLAVVLTVSDCLTLYFGAATVVQIWYSGWVEDQVAKSLTADRIHEDSIAPGFIRWVGNARKRFKLDSTWKILTVPTVGVVFVLWVNFYIGSAYGFAAFGSWTIWAASGGACSGRYLGEPSFTPGMHGLIASLDSANITNDSQEPVFSGPNGGQAAGVANNSFYRETSTFSACGVGAIRDPVNASRIDFSITFTTDGNTEYLTSSVWVNRSFEYNFPANGGTWATTIALSPEVQAVGGPFPISARAPERVESGRVRTHLYSSPTGPILRQAVEPVLGRRAAAEAVRSARDRASAR